MEKPLHGTQERHLEAPSLLSSVAGLLESSVMGVFGPSKGDKMSVSRSSCPRQGDHVLMGKVETSVAVPSAGSAAGASQKLDGPLARESSDDMPELERLGRVTCPASSEDETRSEEVRSYFFIFVYVFYRRELSIREAVWAKQDH